jgi:hypothetical protein
MREGRMISQLKKRPLSVAGSLPSEDQLTTDNGRMTAFNSACRFRLLNVDRGAVAAGVFGFVECLVGSLQ